MEEEVGARSEKGANYGKGETDSQGRNELAIRDFHADDHISGRAFRLRSLDTSISIPSASKEKEKKRIFPPTRGGENRDGIIRKAREK